MIAAWMLFATEVGALMFAAAWIAESVLRASRRPVRGVWVAAIIGTNVLPLLLFALPYRLPQTEKWAFIVSPASMVSRLGTPLVVLWGVAVAVGLFVCFSAVWRMSRTRPSWKTEHVDDTPVLVSHDIGPALVGVLHYSIVVPRWAYGLEESARALLLTHEREHARKYDPLLLAVAVMAVVLAPWNLLNWLLLRRLHLAVELDCDQRVLRAHPDTRGYSALLLDVAERVIPSVLPAAAFVEHGASLETRLNAMTVRKKPFQQLRVSAGLAASVLLVAGACIMPRPLVVIVQPVAPVAQQMPDRFAGPVLRDPSSVSFEEAARPAGPVEVERAFAPRDLNSGSVDVRPVPPSRSVRQLDEDEYNRLRAYLSLAAPRVFGKWPRSDSAVVLLSDGNGQFAKSLVIEIPVANPAAASWVFSTNFMPPLSGLMRSTSQMVLTTGLRGEKLDVPLTVFRGSMRSGAAVPLSVDEAVPDHDTMFDSLVKRHPEFSENTADTTLVGVLFYGPQGQLLTSAVVHSAEPERHPDGTPDATFTVEVLNAAMKQTATRYFFAKSEAILFSRSSTRRVRIAYAAATTMSEMRSVLGRVAPTPGAEVGTSGGSTQSLGRHFDAESWREPMLKLVTSRVPDAFGSWSRLDSAIVFLFDANDLLIGRRNVPMPKDQSMDVISNLVSKSFQGIRPLDVQAIAHWAFSESDTGRELDVPLRVMWVRLVAGKKLPPATR